MLGKIFILLSAILVSATATAADTNRIVATIKPLHSLVAAVLGDSAQATLLISNGASPHGFHLKPSQMSALQHAEIIFYVDAQLETFLPPAFAALPKTIHTLAVAKAPGLTRLGYRKRGPWDDHAHGLRQEAHEEHHGEKHHGDGHHDEEDMHIWLDPMNAVRIVEFIAEKLGAVYPENRDIYRSNARETNASIRRLDAGTKRALAAVQTQPFIVFHDAYQYFEHRYHLTNAGAITSEGNPPSPGHLQAIREKLLATGARCVFREPQFSSRLITTVIEGTGVQVDTLDPLGIELPPGKDLYLRLIEKLAATLEQCLGRP